MRFLVAKEKDRNSSLIPLSEYKYHDNVLKAAGNYNIGDATAKAFFNDAYTRDFIDTCYIIFCQVAK